MLHTQKKNKDRGHLIGLLSAFSCSLKIKKNNHKG